MTDLQSPSGNQGMPAADKEGGWPLVWRLPLLMAATVLAVGLLFIGVGLADLDAATALAIDLALAVVAALVIFLLARRNLAPIEILTRSLALGAGSSSLPTRLEGVNTEIGRLQRALLAQEAREKRQAEVAESESQRAREAMLARLSAGLAHEVRNPLAGMSAAVSTLRRYGDDPDVRGDTIALIERGLASLDRVAASMLSTYRPPEGNRDLEPADLDDVRVLINPKVRPKHLTLQFENGLDRSFRTNADAVRQIALNLLLNATDAAPDGGTVTFVARLGEAALSLHVADTGPGLPDEALSVLTASQGGGDLPGRRLGLWLVHQLIDDVNGRISIASRSDAGTAITITIPERLDTGTRHSEVTDG